MVSAVIVKSSWRNSQGTPEVGRMFIRKILEGYFQGIVQIGSRSHNWVPDASTILWRNGVYAPSWRAGRSRTVGFSGDWGSPRFGLGFRPVEASWAPGHYAICNGLRSGREKM